MEKVAFMALESRKIFLSNATRAICLTCFIVFIFSTSAMAKRSSIQKAREKSIVKYAPAKKTHRSLLRQTTPILTQGALSLTTTHFRIFWGENYQTQDPDWNASDNNQIPIWINVLAESLENAYGTQINLGFSPPYGVSQYYLDVYIANTGISVENVDITLSSDYYAYTDIDMDYQVSYFVFNNDFSSHTDDELDVLRATAAHELFHAVQRVDYPWDDEQLIPDNRFNDEIWWFEATATWMEEICEPAADDYIQYVKNFLRQPTQSLTSSDGLHEYGAAIFAGYLWLEYGGPSLWQDILISLFEKGVESAIREALSKRDMPTFEQVVTRFWSLCAHPQDIWPDGAYFLSDDVQPVLNVNIFPYSSQQLLPERYGASLFKFPQTIENLEAAINILPVESDIRLAISTEGSKLPPSVFQMENSPVLLKESLDSAWYLALVNTGAFLPEKYSLVFENKTIIPADFDNNKEINIKDMLPVFRILTETLPSPYVHLLSDVDGDEKTGLIDNIYILQKIILNAAK